MVLGTELSLSGLLCFVFIFLLLVCFNVSMIECILCSLKERGARAPGHLDRVCRSGLLPEGFSGPWDLRPGAKAENTAVLCLPSVAPTQPWGEESAGAAGHSLVRAPWTH